MGAGRGRNVHGVDFGIFEQIVELRVELGHAVPFGELLRGAFRSALCRAAEEKKREGGGGGRGCTHGH